MKKLKFGHYYLIFFVAFLVFIQLRHLYIQNEINKDGKYIVVKFISRIEKRKTIDFNFSFYLNGKLDTTNASGITRDILTSKAKEKIIDSLKVNSYYFAKWNQKHPEILIVNPEKQVTDSMLIKQFGF
ncbi:hypothetical protein [Flavobacterium succinicans]|uniref:Uncharacterized protein n=1 Tax=Flavobacterium succinicans TaxID=29536 RepID=A0A199XS97_9FLAO|nr:hypothetical protein [Flavobacterium succinicans]OAZ04126.1 hypothetical protein FLB_14820 [Flavobacterium succinicans]